MEHYLGSLIGAIRDDLLAKMQHAIGDYAKRERREWRSNPNPDPTPDPEPNPDPNPSPSPDPNPSPHPEPSRKEWLFDHIAQLSIVGTQLFWTRETEAA